ncbi:hypothetical protein WR25_13589 [Diploscapter pachys]|uniref:Uncharacterized protein n=1 Tax=Diploscapter pachys TaxID=2018661 RepID=A0A2A2LCU2_9BILA|nr:hypothetical protein WR25_13589 [Diploscapter pachys]
MGDFPQKSNEEVISLGYVGNGRLRGFVKNKREICDIRMPDNMERVHLGTVFNCFVSDCFEERQTLDAVKVKIIDETDDESQQIVKIKGNELFIRSKVIVSKELFEKSVMWTEAFGFLRYVQNLDGAKFAEQELYDGWIHYVALDGSRDRSVLGNFIVYSLEQPTVEKGPADAMALKQQMLSELEVAEIRKFFEKPQFDDGNNSDNNKQKCVDDCEKERQPDPSFGRTSFSNLSSGQPSTSRNYQNDNNNRRRPGQVEMSGSIKLKYETKKDIAERILKEKGCYIPCLMLEVSTFGSPYNVAWTQHLGTIYVVNPIVRATQKKIEAGLWFSGKLIVSKSFNVNDKKMANEPIIDSIMELTYVSYQVDVLPNEITMTMPITVREDTSHDNMVFCNVLGYLRLPKDFMADNKYYDNRLIVQFAICKPGSYWTDWQLKPKVLRWMREGEVFVKL